MIKVSAQLDSHKSRRISSNHVPTFQPRSNPVQVGDWKVSKQALQILIAITSSLFLVYVPLSMILIILVLI